MTTTENMSQKGKNRSKFIVLGVAVVVAVAAAVVGGKFFLGSQQRTLGADDVVVHVASGPDFYFAVTQEGELFGWGDNTHGTLGDIGKKMITVPTSIKVPGDHDVVQVAGGSVHALILTEDGSVYSVGNNTDGQLGLADVSLATEPHLVEGLENIVDVAAGHDFSLAVAEGGTVYAWGNNSKGQFGNGEAEGSRVPVEVTTLEGVQDVAAGTSHAVAVLEDGSVYAWGNNEYLNVPSSNMAFSASPLEVPKLKNITSVAARGNYSLALDSSGNVYQWGYLESGGSDSSRDLYRKAKSGASKIGGIPESGSVVAGIDYALAVTTTGEVYGWGNNEQGQINSNDSQATLAPTLVENLSAVKEATAGRNSSVAVQDSGQMLGWGSNEGDQLGVNETTSPIGPTPILGGD